MENGSCGAKVEGSRPASVASVEVQSVLNGVKVLWPRLLSALAVVSFVYI